MADRRDIPRIKDQDRNGYRDRDRVGDKDRTRDRDDRRSRDHDSHREDNGKGYRDGDSREKERDSRDRNRDGRDRNRHRGSGGNRRDLYRPGTRSLYIPSSSSSHPDIRNDDRSRYERDDRDRDRRDRDGDRGEQHGSYRGYDRSRDSYFNKAPPTPAKQGSNYNGTTPSQDKPISDESDLKSLPTGPKKLSLNLNKGPSHPNSPSQQSPASYKNKYPPPRSPYVRGTPNNSNPSRIDPENSRMRSQKATPLKPLPSGPSLPKGPSALQPQKPKTNRISFLKSIRDSTVYERVAQVGEGTYGKVYKAKNRVTGAFVALKRLRMESEKEGFPITAMRETRLLQSFNHPNIVPLLEIMVENKQIYMVFDYADNDLTGILSNPDVKLSDGNRKFLFRQLCEGLNYLHIKRVIHRDIKGSNLLIDRNGVLKIADFGLARKLKTVKSSDYTNRVITLWYRPPELLLGTTDYGREVDIWGIGCLLVELFTKRAVFQAQDEIQQLHVIFEILGTPTFDQWPNLTDLPWYEMVKPSKLYHSQFQKLYGSNLSEKCYELALRMLDYDPKKRITCKEALEHDYFSEEPKEQPLADGVLKGEWHEFEAKKKRRKEREEKKLEEQKKKKQKTGSLSAQRPCEDIGKSGSERSIPNTEKRDSTVEPSALSDLKSVDNGSDIEIKDADNPLQAKESSQNADWMIDDEPKQSTQTQAEITTSAIPPPKEELRTKPQEGKPSNKREPSTSEDQPQHPPTPANSEPKEDKEAPNQNENEENDVDLVKVRKE